MVVELKSVEEVRNFISRNKIAVIAITNKNGEQWRYIEYLLKRLEMRAGYMISFAIAHIDAVQGLLEEFERKIAEKEAIIKMYLEGSCVFEQQGYFGHIASDEQALKRGIKDVLRQYSIKTLF